MCVNNLLPLFHITILFKMLSIIFLFFQSKNSLAEPIHYKRQFFFLIGSLSLALSIYFIQYGCFAAYPAVFFA